jgi:L-rhamnose-H+ transport protein
MKPLKWENYWSIYCLVALILSPVFAAWILVPKFLPAILSIPVGSLYLPLLFGALWGTGSILFGLSLVNLGLSLTYSIILSLTTIIGSIIPLFLNHVVLSKGSLSLLIFGLIFVLFGMALSSYSGKIRGGEQKATKSKFMLGLFLAVLSGVFSPMINIGLVTSKGIAQAAENFGASSANSSFLIWVVLLFSGFLVNISYTIYLLVKNKSMSLFGKINPKILLAGLASGTFWFAGFGLFGIASVNIGKLGPSVGWAILISLTIVVSNVWGIKSGEWKNSKKALNYQLKSIALIVLGVALIATSALV